MCSLHRAAGFIFLLVTAKAQYDFETYRYTKGDIVNVSLTVPFIASDTVYQCYIDNSICVSWSHTNVKNNHTVVKLEGTMSRGGIIDLWKANEVRDRFMRLFFVQSLRNIYPVKANVDVFGSVDVPFDIRSGIPDDCDQSKTICLQVAAGEEGSKKRPVTNVTFRGQFGEKPIRYEFTDKADAETEAPRYEYELIFVPEPKTAVDPTSTKIFEYFKHQRINEIIQLPFELPARDVNQCKDKVCASLTSDGEVDGRNMVKFEGNLQSGVHFYFAKSPEQAFTVYFVLHVFKDFEHSNRVSFGFELFTTFRYTVITPRSCHPTDFVCVKEERTPEGAYAVIFDGQMKAESAVFYLTDEDVDAQIWPRNTLTVVFRPKTKQINTIRPAPPQPPPPASLPMPPPPPQATSQPSMHAKSMAKANTVYSNQVLFGSTLLCCRLIM